METTADNAFRIPAVQCKTCDVGALQRLTRYRLSPVVVTIGYILLLPSFAGIAWGLFLLALAMRGFTSGDSAGAVLGFAMAAVAASIAFVSFLGGLLGWLLVMKKTVLACDHCGATVAAT